ncbi:MAG TPA: M28 family peptidase [Fimbriimonadaceae bacterium]|nr:M28 family peptidase [Fimbriimonadaceae bacterium]
MRRTSHISLAALLLAAFAPFSAIAQYQGALPPPEDLKPGFDAITKDLAFHHLSFLAGPTTQGRGSGQPGFQIAADYVAAQFKAMGLVPITEDGSYFQEVPFYRSGVDPDETRFTGPGLDLKPGSSLAVTARGDADFTVSSVVFVTMKADATVPDSLNLHGKGVFLSVDGSSRRARTALIRRGASFVVDVVDEVPLIGAVVSPQPQSSETGQSDRPPTLMISRRTAMAAARAVGVDPAVFGAGNIGESGINMEDATGQYKLKVKVDSKEVMVPNVIGMLPGSDPELKKQYVGVGAHLDHLGIRNGVVYPGADDDGSGSTAMLMIAKAATTNPVKPKRSVVFMAFCGEELGLIGSGYYTAHPLIPLDQMDCLLQMDMVGRNEEHTNPPESPDDNIDTIHLIGSKRISTELHQLTLTSNRYINFKFEYDEEDVYTRSDHYNFARRGVPITFLFSGFHPDYHQPTDTIDKINFDKIVSAARLNYIVMERAADMPSMLVRDVKGGE